MYLHHYSNDVTMHSSCPIEVRDGDSDVIAYANVRRIPLRSLQHPSRLRQLAASGAAAFVPPLPAADVGRAGSRTRRRKGTPQKTAVRRSRLLQQIHTHLRAQRQVMDAGEHQLLITMRRMLKAVKNLIAKNYLLLVIYFIRCKKIPKIPPVFNY